MPDNIIEYIMLKIKYLRNLYIRPEMKPVKEKTIIEPIIPKSLIKA